MSRRIVFESSAFEDFSEWAKLDKKIHRKIVALIKSSVGCVTTHRLGGGQFPDGKAMPTLDFRFWILDFGFWIDERVDRLWMDEGAIA